MCTYSGIVKLRSIHILRRDRSRSIFVPFSSSMMICYVAKRFISHTVVFPIVAAVRADNTMQVFITCAREYHGLAANPYLFKLLVCGMQQSSKWYKGILISIKYTANWHPKPMEMALAFQSYRQAISVLVI